MQQALNPERFFYSPGLLQWHLFYVTKSKSKQMDQQEFIDRIDWELSYREKWPVDRFGEPIFPRTDDEEVSEEERLKRSAIAAVRAVANMIPGWNFSIEFVETLYDKLEYEYESDDFRLLVDDMGELAKTAFLKRHKTYFKRQPIAGTIIRANEADRFIRRLDWYTSFEKRELYDVHGHPIYWDGCRSFFNLSNREGDAAAQMLLGILGRA